MKSITDAKRNIETSFHKALDELREELANAKVQPSRDSTFDDSRLNSVRDDIKDLYLRSRDYNERIAKLEKLVAEHDDLLNRVVKSCEGKVNKKDHNEVAKDVKRIDETLKQLFDHVNTLPTSAPVMTNEDGTKKHQELERIIVALEEKLDRTREALSQRMNDINKFMDMIKEDLDKTLEDQNKQLMKTLSKVNVCEIRINKLEKLLKDTSPTVNGPSLLELDFKEAIRAIKDLENRLNEIKEDFNKKIIDIEYNKLPTKVDVTDLEKIEKELKEKSAFIERELLKLRMEFQSLSKLHDRISADLKKEKKKEVKDEKDEVSLIKKPLMGFKCANCERDLNNLEATQAEFYNWKKLPMTLRGQQNKRNKISMNLHNIGQGFSKMLQTFSTDNLQNKDLLRSSLMEEEDAEVLPGRNREFLSDNEEETGKINRDPIERNRLLPTIKKSYRE